MTSACNIAVSDVKIHADICGCGCWYGTAIHLYRLWKKLKYYRASVKLKNVPTTSSFLSLLLLLHHSSGIFPLHHKWSSSNTSYSGSFNNIDFFYRDFILLTSHSPALSYFIVETQLYICAWMWVCVRNYVHACLNTLKIFYLSNAIEIFDIVGLQTSRFRRTSRLC